MIHFNYSLQYVCMYVYHIHIYMDIFHLKNVSNIYVGYLLQSWDGAEICIWVSIFVYIYIHMYIWSSLCLQITKFIQNVVKKNHEICSFSGWTFAKLDKKAYDESYAHFLNFLVGWLTHTLSLSFLTGTLFYIFLLYSHILHSTCIHCISENIRYFLYLLQFMFFNLMYWGTFIRLYLYIFMDWTDQDHPKYF